jgi:hypothetical protein
VTLIFKIIRVLLGLFGYLLVLQALYGVPYAASDHAWGPAFEILLGGLFGVWLVRVGINGTFSGNAPSSGRSPHDAAA